MDASDSPHLDLLALEQIRAGGPASARDAAHLAWCAACRAELDTLRRLAIELAGVDRTPAIPADVDSRIRVLADRHAARVRRGRSRRRAAWAGWAAAAAVVFGVSAGLLREPARHRDLVAISPSPLVVVALDVDGDGRVTVLDAFVAARRSDAAAARVDEIMATAVSLGGRS